MCRNNSALIELKVHSVRSRRRASSSRDRKRNNRLRCGVRPAHALPHAVAPHAGCACCAAIHAPLALMRSAALALAVRPTVSFVRTMAVCQVADDGLVNLEDRSRWRQNLLALTSLAGKRRTTRHSTNPPIAVCSVLQICVRSAWLAAPSPLIPGVNERLASSTICLPLRSSASSLRLVFQNFGSLVFLDPFAR